MNRKDSPYTLEKKYKLENIALYNHDEIENSNKNRKISIYQSVCIYYRKLYGLLRDLSNEDLIDSFWISNGTLKITWSSQSKPVSLSKHSSWWRRLQDVFKTNIFALLIRLQKTSSRRPEDVLIKTNRFVLNIRLQDLFKTFSRRLQDVFKTSCQDVFKTFSENVFKTPSRHFQDVFKTSSRRLAKMSLRCFPDVLSS